MTLFEAIRANKSFIRNIANNLDKITDIQYLPIMEEFQAMKADGNKIGYAVSFLSGKYNISERQIYRIIKNFNKQVTFDNDTNEQ